MKRETSVRERVEEWFDLERENEFRQEGGREDAERRWTEEKKKMAVEQSWNYHYQFYSSIFHLNMKLLIINSLLG